MHDWPDKKTSKRVQSLIEKRVGPLRPLVAPTPLSGALQVAAIQVISLASDSTLDEEGITSSLLGSMRATVPWFADIFEDTASPTFNWARYSKGSSSAKGEASTGSDFALMIHFSSDAARAAIFQAKRSKNGENLGIHQISPARNGKHPQPQILRLRDYGLSLLPSDATPKDLHWVHYCGYMNGSFFCRPLSALETLLLEYQTLSEEIDQKLDVYRSSLTTDSNPNKKMLDKAREYWTTQEERTVDRSEPIIELAHLLALGAATPWGTPVGGWLTLENEDAIKAFRETASDVMTVAEATAGHSPKMVNDPNATVASSNQMLNIVEHLNRQAEAPPSSRPQSTEPSAGTRSSPGGP